MKIIARAVGSYTWRLLALLIAAHLANLVTGFIGFRVTSPAGCPNLLIHVDPILGVCAGAACLTLRLYLRPNSSLAIGALLLALATADLIYITHMYIVGCS